MADPDDVDAPEPRTFQLQRKKHAPWLIALTIVAVVGAIAFAVYKIYSATLPPKLH